MFDNGGFSEKIRGGAKGLNLPSILDEALVFGKYVFGNVCRFDVCKKIGAQEKTGFSY